MKNIRFDQVIAMLPVYHDNLFNSTQVIFNNQETRVYPNPIKGVKDKYCQFYAIDQKAIKHQLYQLLHQKNNLPLVCPYKSVFATFKVRQPLMPYDAAYGYFNVDYIQHLDLDKVKHPYPTLTLSTHHTIHILNTEDNASAHFKNAMAAHDYYVARHLFSKLQDMIQEPLPPPYPDL